MRPSLLVLFAVSWPALAQVWSIQHNHDHVQGLEVNERWFWISAVDRRTKTGWIWRVDRQTLRTVTERNITQGTLYHAGGIQISQGSLWVPVAEYRPNSSARILELDPMTLEERRSFAAADHIGAVATDGKSALLGANWDARKIYRWNMKGELLREVRFDHPLAIQDMKWIGDILYAGGVGLGPEKGRCLLYQLNPQTLALEQGSDVGAERCYTHEGTAFFNGRFFFLPEDQPNSKVYVRPAPR